MTTKTGWLERWKENRIGFHEEEPNHFLQSYLSRLSLSKGETIFVPFCGASVDMLYLLQQGYQVMGSELSNIACEKFFADNKLPYEILNKDNFKIYQGENIRLYCGDHYELSPEWFDGVHAVYDRAALIAVQPTEREQYVNKMKTLFSNFSSLLIGIYYADNGQSGPPFRINKSEIKTLFSPMQVINLAASSDSSSCRSVGRRGFVDVQEACYLIIELL